MKKLAVLLTLLLVVTSVMVAGCGRVYTAPNPMPLARTVPHSVGAPFQNCNVCHIADQLGAVIPHRDLDKDTTAGNCLQPGACHGGMITLPPITLPPATTTPPAGTTTPPAGTTTPPAGTTTPPAGTTTPPGGTTPPAGTTTPPAGPPVLTKAALALEIATHPAAYAALCMMCHAQGMGVQQYPLPPTWAGTLKTPGTWTITAGSDADHTGRTDTAACVAAGCHAKPW